jgi:hypothetical protein
MKKKIFLIFAFFIFISVCQLDASSIGDFNEDGLIDDKDVVVMFSFNQIKALSDSGFATLSLETVQDNARSTLGDDSFSIIRLPDPVLDDLNSDGKNFLDDEDVVFLFSFNQIKSLSDSGFASLTFANVENNASGILGKTVSLGKFPGTPIGTASFTTTITGITTDP